MRFSSFTYLVGQGLQPARGDYLLGQDQPHDVVVAHAESLGEAFFPVADSVAVAEDLEGADVGRGVVHQRAVHVEKRSFFHRRVVFSGQR